MKLLIGAFLLAHGVAHLVGFAVPWRLVKDVEVPYKTTLLSGHWDVGQVGIRVVGVVWLIAFLAYAVGAAGLGTGQPWALPFVAAVTVFSLALCLVSLPEARIGAAVDVALLLLVAVAFGFGWV